MTTSANIIQTLFGDDDDDDEDDDDDDDDNNDDKSNNSADDSEDIVVENASKPASACSSSSSWENSIGIIDNVLTIEDCNELIAVHESDPHQGFIDQLTLTRISDLVPPCHTDNDHDHDRTTPAASCVEGISPSTTAAELLASEAATATSTSSSSLVHLTLPLLRARAIMWHAVEHYYGPSVQYELVPEFTSVTGWYVSNACLRKKRTYTDERGPDSGCVCVCVCVCMFYLYRLLYYDLFRFGVALRSFVRSFVLLGFLIGRSYFPFL